MKKLLTIALAAFTYQNAHAQNFVTLYTPGFQLSSFKATNIRLTNGGDFENARGGIHHVLFKGDGIANNLVFGLDVSGVAINLLRGFKDASKSYYASGFEVRLGGAFNLGDDTKLGAGLDIGVKGIYYRDVDKGINMDTYHSFTIMGITVVGLHNFDDKIYMMPKLSFDPVFSTALTTNVVDGLCTKFETSFGIQLLGAIGLTITPGFEHMKFNIQAGGGGDAPITGKTTILAKYLHVGFSFAID